MNSIDANFTVIYLILRALDGVYTKMQKCRILTALSPKHRISRDSSSYTQRKYPILVVKAVLSLKYH
jgi:hypothetical protein